MLTTATQHFVIDGVDTSLSLTYRPGTKAPVVFLHGFGSSKEDYADFLINPTFDGHEFLAYDAPGCGQSTCADPSRLTIPFLVRTAEEILASLKIDRFHLVGHSMGALTGLKLASRHPARVLSFVDIKGNLSPEDCFLSRQIIEYPASDDAVFFREFTARVAKDVKYGSALYAASLPVKVQASSIRPIFTSMVELSDEGTLLGEFLGLPCRRVFMFGEQYDFLSYLPTLQAADGIRLARIDKCGHFPMYSNPQAMWVHIQETLQSGDDASTSR